MRVAIHNEQHENVQWNKINDEYVSARVKQKSYRNKMVRLWDVLQERI